MLSADDRWRHFAGPNGPLADANEAAGRDLAPFEPDCVSTTSSNDDSSSAASSTTTSSSSGSCTGRIARKSAPARVHERRSSNRKEPTTVSTDSDYGSI